MFASRTSEFDHDVRIVIGEGQLCDAKPRPREFNAMQGQIR
jgi:hypothetical protein